MKAFRLIGRLSLILGILMGSMMPTSAGQAYPEAQANDPAAQARAMLTRMTPAERVGQLFLLAFKGNQAGEGTQIYDIIQQYHIGGVILSAANDNFVSDENTISDAYRLISEMQTANYNFTQTAPTPTEVPETSAGNYIPMLIGVSQNGDGYPEDQIFEGVNSLPSLMSIGATWKTDLANQVGQVLGKELEALGVNLVLGPSLDIIDPQYNAEGSVLGVDSFGSDPYWTQEMGKAYISGIHEGSDDRLLVIAKHFPGQGGSDRDPETEVATVRKSLEELKQIELAPFVAITSDEDNPEAVADGFLVSHIRYQGFQGNIREATRPVSLDSNALTQLMTLPEFTTWHQNGGILISDNLGSLSIRRFYESTGQAYETRLVARDAFLAGNDVLYIDNFLNTSEADAYASIVKTLDYFTTKYQDDAAFAQRVDESVLRILTMKYALYPQFDLDTVLPEEDGLSQIQTSNQVIFDVASQAVTLISPTAAELDSILPSPPAYNDRILFITDTLVGAQCSTCLQQNGLSVDALQSAVVRLYGPGAGGEVNPNRLVSYSFEDLIDFLDYAPTATSEPYPLENDLAYSQWIVFSILDVSDSRPASNALRRLLSERPDLLRNKKVVVFSFDAPYYLDATDISKISAYYALFSKTSAFVDVAARVLFHELTPSGASPVSISGIAYDIIDVTSPDPNQVIPLEVDYDQITQSTETGTLTPAAEKTLTFNVNDTIPVKAGPIYDQNGEIVPDNTVVKFSFILDGGATGTMTQEVTTIDGVARASYRIDRAGLLEIRASSYPATTSLSLQLNITGDVGAQPIVITPTPQATETLRPTATFTPTPTQTPTPVPPSPPYPSFSDWFLSMLIVAIGGILAYLAGVYRWSVRWGIRWGLCAILGGLATYIILAIATSDEASWVQTAGTGRVLMITLMGVILGAGAGMGWRFWAQRMRSASPN